MASPAPLACRFIVERPDCTPATWRVSAQEVIEIGSDAACDVVVDAPTVSPRHFRLTLTRRGHSDPHYELTDLGSDKGTHVLGRIPTGRKWVEVQRAPLASGAVFALGSPEAVVRFYVRRDREITTTQMRVRFGHLVGGRAKPMRAVFGTLEKVADKAVSVLVEGETGTGKELVARTLHDASGRSGPFVPVDCAAVAPQLMESELFGHVRGAFSGAIRDHEGLFVKAHGGTLFLDELDSLPLELQTKLLRAIEAREVRPVGTSQTTPVDVRIVAASGKNLEHLAELGSFRRDLFYRLSVVRLRLPPLRDRLEDLQLLVAHLLESDFNGDGQVRGVHGDVYELFRHYPWPGNVRELRNVLQSACRVAELETLHIRDLPPTLTDLVAPGPGGRNDPLDTTRSQPVSEIGWSLHSNRDQAEQDFERSYVRALYRRFRGDAAAAQAATGLSDAAFRELLDRHGFAVGIVEK